MSDFNFAEFIHMGGYATYVWTSWAITIVGMACLVIASLTKRKRLTQELQQQLQQAQAREKRAAAKK